MNYEEQNQNNILNHMLAIDKEFTLKRNILQKDYDNKVYLKRVLKNLTLILIAIPLLCLAVLLVYLTRNFVTEILDIGLINSILVFFALFGILFLILMSFVNKSFSKFKIQCDETLQQNETVLLSIYAEKQQSIISDTPIDIVISAPIGTVFENDIPCNDKYCVYVSYSGSCYHQQSGCSNSRYPLNVFEASHRYAPCSRCCDSELREVIPWQNKYLDLKFLRTKYKLKINGDKSCDNSDYPKITANSANSFENYLSKLKHLSLNNYKIALPKIKPLIIILVVVGIAATLMLAVNSTFRYKEPVYGAYTTCYTNNFSDCYHTNKCIYLVNSKIQDTLENAIRRGYSECDHCTVSNSIFNTCYTTDYGECYHSLNCKYLWNSSNQTTVYNALRSGKRDCSECYVYADLNSSCYIYPYSDSHFHTLNCTYYDGQEVIIQSTNAKKAESDNYQNCPYCSIGTLDVSYQEVNFFGKSLLISVSIVTAACLLLLLIYIISSNIKLNKVILKHAQIH